MITSTEIKEMARLSGADLCGIAPVERFANAPDGFHPYDIFPGTKSVITIAKHEVESTLHSKSAVAYTFATEMILEEIYRITMEMIVKLEKKGHIAIPIPSEPYEFWDEKEMTGKGILSLKHAAYLSGLGVFGRNTLLINKKYGNLIRLGAIITDAELEGDKLDDFSPCSDECNMCIDNCPVAALENDGVIIQKNCRLNSSIVNKKGYSLYVCNLCRKVCPYRAGLQDDICEEPMMMSVLAKAKFD